MRSRGFTLAEVLVTVAIVGILAAVAVSNYGAAVGRARWDSARSVLVKIYTGERAYCSRSVDDEGSEGRNFSPVGGALGAIWCAAGAAGDPCREGWRALGMENPNAVAEAGGGIGKVTAYDVTNDGRDCTTGTFTATAAVAGGNQTVDQEFVFCAGGACSWQRP